MPRTSLIREQTSEFSLAFEKLFYPFCEINTIETTHDKSV